MDMTPTDDLERTRRRALRERGQSTLEFVGITVLAAILVTAVVFGTGNGESVRAGVAQQICKLGQLAGVAGPCVEPPTSDDLPSSSDVPTYLDPNLTPQEQAESGEYVALGDSFSSGEGGSEYDPETDENYQDEVDDYYDNLDENGEPQDQLYCHQYGCVSVPPTQFEAPYSNMCHRSEGAYSQGVSETFDFAGGYTFAACSGAVTEDFTSPNDDNQGEPAQIDNVDEDTSLITFTIGGNDAKFADTLTGCIEAGLNPFAQCLDDDDEQERVEDDIEQAIENMRELLPQIRAAAPNARILVLGYPRFFPEDPGSGWSDGTQIDTEDIREINNLVADMNDQIEDLVNELNEENPGSFQFVDTEDAFDGCEIGTDDACMNNIEVRFADGKPDKNGSYHPNDRGHEQLQQLVEEAIRDGQ